MSEFEPLIIHFSCRWAGADTRPQGFTGRLVSLPIVCAGNVHPNAVVEALSTGADGVLLTACAQSGCHYPEGDEKARARAEAVALLLEDFGLEAERFRFAVLGDGAAELDALLSEMAETLRALGPNPYA